MILLSCNRYCMRLAILTTCLIADTVSHPMVKPNHKSIPVSCSQLDRHSLKSVCSGLFARFEPPCVEKFSVCVTWNAVFLAFLSPGFSSSSLYGIFMLGFLRKICYCANHHLAVYDHKRSPSLLLQITDS